MGVRSALIGAAIASLAAASMTPAAALTAQECSAKYQAAKAAGTLAGQSWQDFRKAQCGADAAPAAAAAKEAKSEKPEKPARESKAAAPIGNAVFPAAVDPKYAGEKAARARMKTCADQFKANKAANANGGMRWIEKGGGYYSACNKRLKGA